MRFSISLPGVQQDRIINDADMKQLFVFIRKEFYHVFRDKRTLLIMFGLPIAQILLFGYAITSEVKNSHISISDNSRDANTEQLINKIKSSSYFIVDETSLSEQEIESTLKKGDVKCILVFPPDFGKDLLHSGKAQVQIIADGSDPNTAKTLVNYLTAIIANYQQEISPTAARSEEHTSELQSRENL